MSNSLDPDLAWYFVRPDLVISSRVNLSNTAAYIFAHSPTDQKKEISAKKQICWELLESPVWGNSHTQKNNAFLQFFKLHFVKFLTLIPCQYFVQKYSSVFYVCCLYSNALQTNFIMDANTMNTDQSVPFRNSLIWVHNICKRGFQSLYTDKRADDNCRKWWEKF